LKQGITARVGTVADRLGHVILLIVSSGSTVPEGRLLRRRRARSLRRSGWVDHHRRSSPASKLRDFSSAKRPAGASTRKRALPGRIPPRAASASPPPTRCSNERRRSGRFRSRPPCPRRTRSRTRRTTTTSTPEVIGDHVKNGQGVDRFRQHRVEQESHCQRRRGVAKGAARGAARRTRGRIGDPRRLGERVEDLTACVRASAEVDGTDGADDEVFAAPSSPHLRRPSSC